MPLPTDPDAVSASDWEAMMARRTAFHANRIAAEMAERGERFIPRGRARRVVRNDRTEYESVSEAARKNDIRKTDNICQAIRRNGMCGGWRWAYLGDEPAGFYRTAASAPLLATLVPAPTGCWPRYKRILPPPSPNRRPLRPAA